MRKLLYIALFIASVAPLSVQGQELLGIGLSGTSNHFDTTAVNGRDIFVIGSVVMGVDTQFAGVYFPGQSDDRLMVSFYDSIRPGGTSIDDTVMYIAPGGIRYDDVNYSPPRFFFHFALPRNFDETSLSMQLQFGVIGRLFGIGEEVYGDPKTSHAPAGAIETCQNPVDPLYSTFLRIEYDSVTEPPILLEPVSGVHIGSETKVRYTLPEPALKGSPTIIFQWVGGEPDTMSHIVYLSDTLVGEDKSITLFCTRLSETVGVDSISSTSGNALVHHAYYNLEFRYRDFIGNAPSSDMVLGLLADLWTEAPSFILPAAGSSSQSDSLPVRYVLPEPAIAVILNFYRTAGESDPGSPHYLTLWEGGRDSGETSFWLDGLNIGTDNPYIDDNPHGEEDSLRRTDYTAGVYDVRFLYLDTLSNPSEEIITHAGFIFGRDVATAPPTLELPRSNTADNAEFTVKFNLPELASENSVKIYIHEFLPPHGNQVGRILTLGALNQPGVYTIELNGDNLLSSEDVTDIVYTNGDPSYNALSFYHSYRVVLSYSDAAGHASAESNIADPVIYDNQTYPADVVEPVTGTIFNSEDFEVTYILAERPLEGSHKVVFLQTGGLVPDHNSPHVFYPSYRLNGGYQLVLPPLNLLGSEGLDSMDAGQTFIPNSIYKLSIEYQDTLANPIGSQVIADLTYLTGATVTARGGIVQGGGIAVIPNAEDVSFFRMTLVAEGAVALLKGVTFDITGTDMDSSDFVSGSIQFWESIDTLFDPIQDLLLKSLQSWTPPQITFSNLSSIVPVLGKTYFFTGSFSAQANPAHSFEANITNAASINCAGDPVTASQWPLGVEDRAVYVDMLTFQVRADSIFDALLLFWRVASEHDNRGFNIWRSETPDSGFISLPGDREDLTIFGVGNHAYTYTYSWLDDGVDGGKTYYYRLESVGINQDREFYAYTISGTPIATPSDYQLFQNCPNPFNGSTVIEYIVPTHSRVYLTIYDVLGRKVRTLVNGQAHNPALYRVTWDGRNEAGGRVASGIYFYQMRGERGFSKARKMLFLQ
ncbi:T9SS type A sorting domain-containing protein [bacterium]|nr:T9SS type A sorting domain-containing protein [bacterium]MBU1936883.1 T9SS type A sorting domain-containing protein [bacterium]